MVEDGQISRGKGDLAELGTPPTAAVRPLSEVLQEQRGEETA
jgi:hypothetical protein